MFVLSLDQEVFSIFGLGIKWYAIFYLLAFYSAVHFISKEVGKNYSKIISAKSLENFLFLLLPVIIITSRIGHVVFFDWDYYSLHPIEILNIRAGGLAFHGGLIGIVIYTVIYSFIKKIPILFISDFLSYGASIALAIGRCGNFVNQELYGIPTSSWYGVVFSSVDSIPRHPVQLYESLAEGIICFICIKILLKKEIIKFGQGIVSVIFLINYSLARFFIDFLKDPITESLKTGQILSIVMFCSSIVLLLTILCLKDKNKKD